MTKNHGIATQTQGHSCPGPHRRQRRCPDPVDCFVSGCATMPLVVRNAAPQLMTGALMSARYDMEATGRNVAQLRERVELLRVKPTHSVEVRLLSQAGMRSTGGVA